MGEQSEAKPQSESRPREIEYQKPKHPSEVAGIEAQVAVKAVIELATVGYTGLDRQLIDDVVAWCRARIPAAKQPESKPSSAELVKLFWKACKAAGNNPDTNEGIANIKAWIKKAGKTELPFCDLSPEKQGELIKMMQAEKLP